MNGNECVCFDKNQCNFLDMKIWWNTVTMIVKRWNLKFLFFWYCSWIKLHISQKYEKYIFSVSVAQTTVQVSDIQSASMSIEQNSIIKYFSCGIRQNNSIEGIKSRTKLHIKSFSECSYFPCNFIEEKNIPTPPVSK